MPRKNCKLTFMNHADLHMDKQKLVKRINEDEKSVAFISSFFGVHIPYLIFLMLLQGKDYSKSKPHVTNTSLEKLLSNRFARQVND